MSSFFQSPDVQGALLAGTVVAAVSAVVGYFVVLRGISFAGHAVTDIGMTGGAGALLAGFEPLIGLIVFTIGAACAIATVGERPRDRDLATGIVLSLAFGLGALFLYLQTHLANAQSALLFGSLFDTDPTVLRVVTFIGTGLLLALMILYRPLLFASVAPDAAVLAGVPVRMLGYAFLLMMALGVAETAQLVGVLISTALLIGPAATAMAISRRPLPSIGLAIMLSIAQVWLSIALAYASFEWSHGRAWPVSFFVSVLALVTFLVARVINSARRV